jgi:hypothetical protein
MAYLPKDLIYIVLEYAINDFYVLHDWVLPAKLDYSRLSENPMAIDYLYDNLYKVSWYFLAMNPNPLAKRLLLFKPFAERDLKWHSYSLSAYMKKYNKPIDVEFIKWQIKNTPHKVDWVRLSSNPGIFKNNKGDTIRKVMM